MAGDNAVLVDSRVLLDKAVELENRHRAMHGFEPE